LARKRNYANALDILNDEQKKEDSINKETKDVNKDVDKDVNNNVQDNVSENVNIESKHTNETNSLNDLSKSINAKFEEKTKKKTMEETHTRKTFLIENELLKEFNRLTKNKRGYQTMLINEVLRAVIESQKKS
jgi:uncharacterized protein (DUF4415 family)